MWAGKYEQLQWRGCVVRRPGKQKSYAMTGLHGFLNTAGRAGSLGIPHCVAGLRQISVISL